MTLSISMLCTCSAREPSEDGLYCTRCNGRLEAFHQECLENAVSNGDRLLWDALEVRTVLRAEGKDATVAEWWIRLIEAKLESARAELAAWRAEHPDA